ncbi:MAG: hypothetical protein Q9179_000221 [Wetmoreana sp. 5 TL-2023]
MSDGSPSDADPAIEIFPTDNSMLKPKKEKTKPLTLDIHTPSSPVTSSPPTPLISTPSTSKSFAGLDKQHNEKNPKVNYGSENEQSGTFSSIVDYADEDEQLNSELQLVFDQHAQVGRQAYEKVAVLLVSWDDTSNDLNTKGEVDDLTNIFREVYHYKIRNVRLQSNGDVLAQVQVNKDIASFVFDEDGPSTLLIVYYAGHGTPGHKPGRLELTGKRVPTLNPLDTVVWNYAEASLQSTKADIFEIFDCCYAGDLRSGRGCGTRRCFEFLGATSSGATTKSPGPKSFTRGLIWALTALSKEPGRFTSVTLAKKIREAPNFPTTQVPILTDRNELQSWHKIVIAPLLKDEQATKIMEPEVAPLQPWGYLYLRISLEQRPCKTEVEDFAKNVSLTMHSTELKARHTKWGGMYRSLSLDGIHSPTVRRAARKFLQFGKEVKTHGHRRQASSTSLAPLSLLTPPGTQALQAGTHNYDAGQPLEIPCLKTLSEPNRLHQAVYHFGEAFRCIRGFVSWASLMTHVSALFPFTVGVILIVVCIWGMLSEE